MGNDPSQPGLDRLLYCARSMRKSLWVLLLAPVSFGQAAEDAAGAAFCAGCGALFIVIPILLIAVHIWMLVWVARDARSRGLDPAMWVILVVLTSFIGLVVYLFSRPQGNLVTCAHCGNRRMQAGVVCPACQRS